MNKNIIPNNGLPKEVTDIPFGQIIILTNPEIGLTSKTIRIIEGIFTLSNKCGQNHIINTRSVQYPGLWDCVVCKVQTDKGVQILISDKESLFELLCEFWGLDYKEVSKSIVFDGRAKEIPSGGKSHPLRMSITSAKKSGKEPDTDNTIRLQALTTHTKERELAKIEDILEDCINHRVDISATDLVILLDKVSKREKKTYQLKIKINLGNEGFDPTGKVYDKKRSCEFWLIDAAGNQHSFTLGAQPTAIYLTFILFKEGKKLADLKTNDEFYNIFKHICERLKSINSIPDKATLKEYVNHKRKVIKKAIKDVTNDDKSAQELFAIEGIAGEIFKVKGATDENRDYIRKMFDIK